MCVIFVKKHEASSREMNIQYIITDMRDMFWKENNKQQKENRQNILFEICFTSIYGIFHSFRSNSVSFSFSSIFCVSLPSSSLPILIWWFEFSRFVYQTGNFSLSGFISCLIHNVAHRLWHIKERKKKYKICTRDFVVDLICWMICFHLYFCCCSLS